MLAAAACSSDGPPQPSESSEPPDAIIPLIQLLEFGADASYQAAYEVERPTPDTENSAPVVQNVELDTEALGVEAPDANLVVSHTPEAVRLDFVRLDEAIALIDIDNTPYSCTIGTDAEACEEIAGTTYAEEIRPVGAFIPIGLAAILTEEQDWKGAEVEVGTTSVEIDGLPSTCATVRGVEPTIRGGANDIHEWELCVTDDGVLARYEAGETRAELVDFRSGVPEELLTIPDESTDVPDDPVLAVALEVGARVRSLATLEGEEQNPRRVRFLEQIEDENLAVRLIPSDDFEANGRVTVLTGRGAACLDDPRRTHHGGRRRAKDLPRRPGGLLTQRSRTLSSVPPACGQNRRVVRTASRVRLSFGASWSVRAAISLAHRR